MQNKKRRTPLAFLEFHYHSKALKQATTVMDITRKGRIYDLEEWRAIFDFKMESALELEGTKHDIFHLVRENHRKGIPFPKTYLWCGTEDPLILTNRSFRDLLKELSIDHLYEESEGNHRWKWWDLHIQDAFRYFFDTNKDL